MLALATQQFETANDFKAFDSSNGKLSDLLTSTRERGANAIGGRVKAQ